MSMLPMKVVVEAVGKVGDLDATAAGIPWPVKVQVVDVRQSYGTLQYLVADAATENGPAAWVMAYRVTNLEKETS